MLRLPGGTRAAGASARLLALLALLGVSGELALHVVGIDAPAHLAWAATTALLLVPLTASVTWTLLRRDVGRWRTGGRGGS
jgi:hypothetical protein